MAGKRAFFDTSKSFLGDYYMRKTVVILIYILVGCFLSGCDFYSGYSMSLTPNETDKPAELNVALQNDFNTITRIVESFAAQQGFEELLYAKESFHRYYQKNERNRVFQIWITCDTDNDVILINVVEWQTRKRRKALEKMYFALRDRLWAEFSNDRIKCGLLPEN
jgi:hypothetical protein